MLSKYRRNDDSLIYNAISNEFVQINVFSIVNLSLTLHLNIDDTTLQLLRSYLGKFPQLQNLRALGSSKGVYLQNTCFNNRKVSAVL